jgi:hypothetical protein
MMGARHIFAEAEQKAGMQGAASPLPGGGSGAVPSISLPSSPPQAACSHGLGPCKRMTDTRDDAERGNNMLLSDIETMTRQDLFDIAAERWTQTDIDRAINKAVDRYSQYYPHIAYVDMQMQPYQRTYPYPQPWNSSYPVLWIEKILYPLQVYGSQYPEPDSAPTCTVATGTALNVGEYQYRITYITQGGETPAGPAGGVTTSAGLQRVVLSNIPVASSIAMQSNLLNIVLGRNIYRTQVGGTTFFLLTTLQDNTTTTYSDGIADSTLDGKPQPPTVNTSGIMYWPPCERPFAEYSHLYDSSTALAAGGNVGIGSGLVGGQTPSFTLQISAAELPHDNSSVMRVFYATRHQLDVAGSTIPELHRDCIVLGATAYAMEAYQVPTNDNFDFQDGGLHDRVNDAMIPLAWLKATQQRWQRFEAQLSEIKRQRDFASSSIASWSDVPLHWRRL